MATEWKPKVLKLPFDRKPYKAYVVFGNGTRTDKVGEYSDEDEAIRAAETEAFNRNS